ncbi:hypothetical protein ACFYN3_42615 [Streptomyces lavendulae]|uniref:hypothetical protein n=1 Tax=Streptomyces lavendulae TaxID=1914 RepID=UPI0036B2D7FA
MVISGKAVGAIATVLALAISGCKSDTAPEWGYPKLAATLRQYGQELASSCDNAIDPLCRAKLERLEKLAELAFGQVLDYMLLDGGYVDSLNCVEKAKERRIAAVREALSRSDPGYPPMRKAVAAEIAAYRQMLVELERVRVIPPPGDGFSPV